MSVSEMTQGVEEQKEAEMVEVESDPLEVKKPFAIPKTLL
jgi:hypothetical protein